MAKTRQAREKINTEDYDLLIPLDIFTLGSEEDPCFGKHHDLAASECKECGDSEFCAIVKAQGLHKTRLEKETKQRFKDIEESDKEMVNKKSEAKERIDGYKENGIKRLKTILKVSKELNLPKKTVKQIYDQN